MHFQSLTYVEAVLAGWHCPECSMELQNIVCTVTIWVILNHFYITTTFLQNNLPWRWRIIRDGLDCTIPNFCHVWGHVMDFAEGHWGMVRKNGFPIYYNCQFVVWRFHIRNVCNKFVKVWCLMWLQLVIGHDFKLHSFLKNILQW